MRLEAKSGASVRTAAELAWHTGPTTRSKLMNTAWGRLLADVADVKVAWDTATGVASRMVLAGVEAANSVDDATIAEQHARAFLAKHLELLAPGAQVSDFKLAANKRQGKTRAVGFIQTYQGAPVLGGQIGFRYQNDRLILVSSEAVPHIAVPRAGFVISDRVAEERALDWVLADVSPQADLRGAVAAPEILPLIGETGVLETREVRRVTIDTTAPVGRYEVFVDAKTGEPVARRQTLMFGQASVVYDTPIRGPHAARGTYPAAFANQAVNGVPTLSDAAGVVSWDGSGVVDVRANVEGPYIRIVNEAGSEAFNNVQVADGGQVQWVDPGNELVDAQLTTFIHTNLVNSYVRNIDPSFAWLDEQINGVVNIEDVCNAYSDGHNIHFFQSSGQCANTGQLTDVVYHEFGHSAHSNVIIPGVGAFDGALSEGISDYLAATIVDDSGMGRGFFKTDEPLRELDPDGYEWHWPEDRGEVHYEGQIIGGTLWDLRQLLRQKLGDAAGIALADRIFLEGISRAVNIPSMYLEALVIDDNDGNLLNGTPNVCEINKAFGDHGLRTMSAEVTDIGRVDTVQNGYEIKASVDGLIFPECGDMLGDATLEWKVRGQAGPTNSVPMSANGLVFAATIPQQAPNTVIQYRVQVGLVGGNPQSYPQNLGDPWFEFYVGDVVPLYCTSFEDNDGWQLPGSWEIGQPQGAGGDPEDARGGDNVLGTVLGGTGMYPAFSSDATSSPMVDTLGYDVVRLQYRRWLRVEDSFYDVGNILANGGEVWRNTETQDGTTHHLDHQWRFHDVDLSSRVQNGKVQLQFSFESDAGLEFGGWNIDDLCIVGVGDVEGPGSCGDGIIDPDEICDDGPGNSASVPDACRPDCTPAACGDGVVDSGESCDDGNLWGGDGCSATCNNESGESDTTTAGPETESDSDGTETGETDTDTGDLAVDGRGCGCRSSDDTAPIGTAAVALLMLGLRRRRRD